MDRRRALIPCLHILLHVFIFVGFIVVAPLGGVHFNYTYFAKQVLEIEDVVVCPPNCTIDLAPQRHDPRAVIVVDNPSGIPVALSVNTPQGQGKLITTDRTTRVEVFFNGGLYVDVYPLYPLSDAQPRSVYLPSGGNLTIRVTPPAIAGTLPTLIAAIGTVIGIMASLGIIRRVTRTPLVDAVGDTSSTYTRVFFIWVVVIMLLLICAGILQTLCGLYLLDILGTFLPLIIAIIYVCIIIVQEPDFVNKILYLILAIPLFIIIIQYMYNLHLRFILFIAFVNPIILIYFKSFAAVEIMERAKKVGVLHLYDLTVVFWVFQWLINPYPAIFSRILYNLSFQFIFFLLVIMVYLGLFVAILYLIAKGPGFGTLLLSAIPFTFNEELAARIEFCRKALDWPTRVKVYPEERGEPVEGFVVECDMGKIGIDNGKSTRVFSWGDVRQIELL